MRKVGTRMTRATKTLAVSIAIVGSEVRFEKLWLGLKERSCIYLYNHYFHVTGRVRAPTLVGPNPLWENWII